MSSKQIDVNKVISNTIIAVTQVITQTAQASQLINLNCTTNQDNCNTCIRQWVEKYKEAGQDPLTANIESACSYVCNCSMQDIDLSQKITCNFTALQNSIDENTFFNSFKDNLELTMYQEDNYLPGLGSPANVDAVQKKVNAVFSELKSNTFQSALQALQATQIVSLEGPGSITSVSMSQMVNVISNSTQSNEQVSTAINELQNALLTMTSAVADAGLTQLIASLLMILAIIIIVIVLIFTCQNFLLLIPSLLS